jgi:hypothetical protein
VSLLLNYHDIITIKTINTILMKSFFLFFLFFLIVTFASAQQTYLDSLKQELNHARNGDTNRVLALFNLADYYGFIQFDSCLFYAAQTSELSQQLNYTYGKVLGYWATFHGLNSQGNYAKALEIALKLGKTTEEIKNERPWIIPQAHYFLGFLNLEMSEYPEAKMQFYKSIELQKKLGEPPTEEIFASYSQLGSLYLNTHRLDSALICAQRGYDLGIV